jgi:hypothetical protein
MKVSSLILLPIGIVIGLLLYRYLFPVPPLPEPELKPGEPVIVFRDTTLYDTVYADVPIPVDLMPEPDTEYSYFEKEITLFDRKVEFTVSGRAIDLQDFRITNARLHLQEKTITITDTLLVPYAHPVQTRGCIIELFGVCLLPDNFRTGVFVTVGAIVTYIYWSSQ